MLHAILAQRLEVAEEIASAVLLLTLRPNTTIHSFTGDNRTIRATCQGARGRETFKNSFLPLKLGSCLLQICIRLALKMPPVLRVAEGETAVALWLGNKPREHALE
jgi:hypothetical protein